MRKKEKKKSSFYSVQKRIVVSENFLRILQFRVVKEKIRQCYYSIYSISTILIRTKLSTAC